MVCVSCNLPSKGSSHVMRHTSISSESAKRSVSNRTNMDPKRVEHNKTYPTVEQETRAKQRELEEAKQCLYSLRTRVAAQEKQVAACRQGVQLHCELTCGHDFDRIPTRHEGAHYECKRCGVVSFHKPLLSKASRKKRARANALE